ncbi:MAG: transglycosylase SLT domain-containing protein [Opitutales bacterium]
MRAWLVALVAAALLWSGCSGPRERAERERPTTTEVWAFISKEATRNGLDPHFVFAIAQAESSLDPSAESYNGFARGMMQMSEGAWQTVSDKDWDYAWNWEENVRMGVAYLVHLREQLERARAFSYPNLAAAYRFGPGTLRREGYRLNNLQPKVKNRVYQQLLQGNIRPVPAPI